MCVHFIELHCLIPLSREFLKPRESGSIPGSQRSPGGEHGNPLQYSWVENPMDRGAWWATAHRAAQSRTWLKRFSTHAHTHAMIQLTSLSKEKELTSREGIQTKHSRRPPICDLSARAWLWLPSSFWTPAVRQPQLWPEKELCLPDACRCLCDSRDSIPPPLTHRQAW